MNLKDIFYFKATLNSTNSLSKFTFSTKIYKINNCCNLLKYVFIIPVIYGMIITTLQNNIQLFDHNLYCIHTQTYVLTEEESLHKNHIVCVIYNPVQFKCAG